MLILVFGVILAVLLAVLAVLLMILIASMGRRGPDRLGVREEPPDTLAPRPGAVPPRTAETPPTTRPEETPTRPEETPPGSADPRQNTPSQGLAGMLAFTNRGFTYGVESEHLRELGQATKFGDKGHNYVNGAHRTVIQHPAQR